MLQLSLLRKCLLSEGFDAKDAPISSAEDISVVEGLKSMDAAAISAEDVPIVQDLQTQEGLVPHEKYSSIPIGKSLLML